MFGVSDIRCDRTSVDAVVAFKKTRSGLSLVRKCGSSFSMELIIWSCGVVVHLVLVLCKEAVRACYSLSILCDES